MGRAFDKYLGRNTTLGLALWGPPNILQRSEALLFEHLQMRIVVYHVQILEENIRSMEPEIPKLMAEVANAKKMERAAAAVAAFFSCRRCIRTSEQPPFINIIYTPLLRAGEGE
ncbi:uncharacterized protein LOC108218361 isoform X2 [Daucus carota subsp. sativus]|uniref:uncharacterized protein LOC108218361 isoform X2 n=1 Tax=Daucus carota subsp. sativus TaxID=79200 RepID=UPI0030826CCC